MNSRLFLMKKVTILILPLLEGASLPLALIQSLHRLLTHFQSVIQIKRKKKKTKKPLIQFPGLAVQDDLGRIQEMMKEETRF